MKDTAAEHLVLVATIEALIAGHGLNEAILRENAYAEAGADAILIHLRKSTAYEMLSFVSEWRNRLPVVIVLTSYYRTPASTFRDAGISAAIWANHSLRAAAAAMRRVCDSIATQEGVAGIESHIAPLSEIFELLKYDELAAAEKQYLRPR
ncbi:isocitrate lyase/phosphoenolpyruvate mutase family protein [Bradyrhizobium sp. Rc3b]|uniref:isocitrate lyase/phosphoenolpyruvate mutase family protein n=1 Tax=Bradyrhizobium sp. Rc3b TaxID=1855322 RepID=UPI0032DF000E